MVHCLFRDKCIRINSLTMNIYTDFKPSDPTHIRLPENSDAKFKVPQQDAGRDLVSLACSILEDNPYMVDVSLQFQNPISVDRAKKNSIRL